MNQKKISRILIIDDEPNNIDALCKTLMPSYDILVARTGQSALEKARTHLPDLILLDIVLPDMTGFQVISELKDDDATRRIPVIFITGLDSTENEERGFLLGAVDYIQKPFNGAIVQARVRTHLQIMEYIATIERLCRVDTLTGLPNRRHFDTQIATEWDRALRESEPLGLLMIDIDSFKGYNDSYGHPQGDALLKAVAAVFEQSICRPGDFVARWGGEEFAVLLPNTDTEGAVEVAERIRAQVARTDIPCASGQMTNTTISIGVAAETPVKNRSYEDLISAADKALYRAKMAGKNRVCV